MPESASEPALEPPLLLDDVARRTLRLDLIASVLFAATQAVLEMGGALAKKGFDATDGQVALLTSGQCLGLILSFFTAHLAMRWRKMPLVAVPEAARSVALVLVFLLSPGFAFALAFVALHAAAQMFQSMTIPARITIYRLNYPSELRGKIVGNNRRVQFVIAAVVSLGVSAVLDGKVSVGPVFELFGRSAPSPGDLVVWLVPLIGLLGLAATLVFAGAPVREARGGPGQGPEPCPEPDREPRPEPAALGSLLDTLRAFAKVWWEDRDFRRYENFFFIFGFANIMTIPLTQIHAVDRLEADYWDLALINVAIVQGLMAVTLPFWGKLVDRHPPARLRGFINLILALDFLTLAVAPTIEWVYAGRVCRGIALGGGTLVWMLGSLYYARTPDKVPIYLGVHTVLTGLRWALAPFAGVWLKQLFRDDARPVFGLVFAVVAVTALLMIWQSRREEPRRPVEGPPMPAPRMTGA